MGNLYRKSGVDIDAGNQFVKNIKPLIERTKRPEVMGSIGGFGGFFALSTRDIKEPVLVSGTDGVGTKLKVAIEMEVLDTIGIDLVAMCVNDIACSGATPLFFLDYFATGKLKPDEHTKIIEGIAKACQITKCALIGGETAEMPDMYAENDFDLAGFAVGVVDKNKIIDGSEISNGNAIIGLASSGFHSNGFSLVRHVVKSHGLMLGKTYDGFTKPLGLELLNPTKLYSPIIASLKKTHVLKGIAHITGGGFYDNIPRILPAGVKAVIERSSWEKPLLFSFFQEHGQIEDKEMLRVFNCGIGMVLVVNKKDANTIIDSIKAGGEDAYLIGQIAKKQNGEDSIVID